MFRMIAAALALAATVSTSSASEPFLAEIRIFAAPWHAPEKGSCTVARINSAYKPGEKKLAGPFRSRVESLEAMQRIPECQTPK